MPSTICATYFSQILPKAKSAPSSLLTHLHEPTLHLLYQATRVIRLVSKLNLVGPSRVVNRRIVSQPPISSPQVSRRRHLFSMCQVTEQMNLNLRNLFNSSGILKQMAIRKSLNKFTQNKKNSFLIFWKTPSFTMVRDMKSNCPGTQNWSWKTNSILHSTKSKASTHDFSVGLCCKRTTIRHSWETSRKATSNLWKCKIFNTAEIRTYHTILWKISKSPEKSVELQMQLHNCAVNGLIQNFLQDQISLITF